jgi:hypothetical protein
MALKINANPPGKNNLQPHQGIPADSRDRLIKTPFSKEGDPAGHGIKIRHAHATNLFSATDQ